MATKTITVKTDEENPESIEIIADALIKISEAFEKMKNSKLTKRALLVLIHDNCGVAGSTYRRKKPTLSQIEEVLDSVYSLKKAYLKDLSKNQPKHGRDRKRVNN